MMEAAALTARQEWARNWPLPFSAMLGIAAMSAFAYTHGIFIDAVTSEFGWTHAQFSSAFTLQMLILLVLSPVVGRLVDRYGPRRIALLGVVPYAVGISALSLANGLPLQWQILCVLQGVCAAFVGMPVWITAVVMRFNTSRGLALATALASTGVATMAWPLLGAWLLTSLGWRASFPAMGLIYLVIVGPLVWFNMPRGRILVQPAAGQTIPAGGSNAEVLAALRSRAWICVVLAGALFATVTLGLGFHMVPILTSKGFDLTVAAGVASVVGLASLCGRLGTGVLLDRLPVRAIGIVAFLVPTISVVLLIQDQLTLPMAFAAAIIFGLASGAETDVVTYLVSRRFEPVFGTVFTISTQIFGAMGSMGPLLASTLFDYTGSYDTYIMLIVPIMVTGALLMWLVPPAVPPPPADPRE